MSIKVMTQVWQDSTAANSNLLLLLAIADFANDNGEAFAHTKTLAKKCRLSERAVQVAINTLVAADELIVKRGAGPGHSNLYCLTCVRKSAAPRPNAPPAETDDIDLVEQNRPPRNGRKTAKSAVPRGADSAQPQNLRSRGADSAVAYKEEPSINQAAAAAAATPTTPRPAGTVLGPDLTPEAARSVGANQLLHWVGKYRPQWKGQLTAKLNAAKAKGRVVYDQAAYLRPCILELLQGYEVPDLTPPLASTPPAERRVLAAHREYKG